MKKLYIKPHKGTNLRSIKSVIDSLYREVSTGKRRKYARPTFVDKGLTKVECKALRRSFEDLLVLARTYFPSTTEVKLMEVLTNLGIGFNYCHQIHKIVMFFYPPIPLVPDKLKDYNVNVPYAKGTYTSEQLIELYNKVK